MSLEISLFAVVLAGALAAYVALPLFERQPDPDLDRPSLGGTRRQIQMLDTLRAEKFRTLRAIRDLDLDYDMGKLTNEGYEAQRVYLFRLAIAITQRMDELEDEIYAQESRIEAALADFRAAR